MKSRKLPAMPDMSLAAKLLAQFDRSLAEADRHAALGVEKREEEQKLLTRAELTDPAQFKTISDLRLFVELCDRKVPQFQAEAERIAGELEPVVGAAKVAWSKYHRELLDLHRHDVGGLLESIVEDRPKRERLVFEIVANSRLARIASPAGQVYGGVENPVAAARRWVEAGRDIEERLPQIRSILGGE